MKQTLLLFSLLATTLTFAQILQSDNFNCLTVGNVGTDITGATTGQGGWFTLNTSGSTNSNDNNYQVVLRETGNNAIQVIGSNAASGIHYMWKSGLQTNWAGRTNGNNII